MASCIMRERPRNRPKLSEDCEAGPHTSRDLQRHCQVPVEDKTEITDFGLRLYGIRTTYLFLDFDEVLSSQLLNAIDVLNFKMRTISNTAVFLYHGLCSLPMTVCYLYRRDCGELELAALLRSVFASLHFSVRASKDSVSTRSFVVSETYFISIVAAINWTSLTESTHDGHRLMAATTPPPPQA